MDDILLDGKTALVRVDFNVTVGADGVVDENEDYRIQAALSTIEELVTRRCKVVLLTHLGWPLEEPGDADLAPVRDRLKELLHEDVRIIKQLHGDAVRAVVAGLGSGSVALLPNVRLDERELSGSERFAQELAGTAEVYVNEAFSVSHRNHTSVALVPRLLPSCAGRRTVQEVSILDALAQKPKRPYVAIVSGAKVHTKMRFLQQLLQKVDRLCVGGVIANAFLAARGEFDAQRLEATDVAAARDLWKSAHDKIVLPEDVVIGTEQGEGAATVAVENIPPDAGGIWDVGPQTVNAYLDVCSTAETIMWNGPLGMHELAAYRESTDLLAKGLAALPSFRIIGGGDTVIVLKQLRLLNKFSHVSVGGGAMIAFLEGSPMPGLEPLYATD
jgi:phosphoglycerate kinase